MTAFATQLGFRAPVSPSAQDESVKVDQKLSYKFGMNPSTKRCLVCNGMHQLWNCEKFKNKSYNDRIKDRSRCQAMRELFQGRPYGQGMNAEKWLLCQGLW